MKLNSSLIKTVKPISSHSPIERMKRRTRFLLALLAVSPLVAGFSAAQDNAQTPAPSSVNAPESGGAAPLRVMVGKSLLINTTERLKRAYDAAHPRA